MSFRYMTKLHYWECGLIRKRIGMPKDYGVVNWPYSTYIIYTKRMLDTRVNNMLKEVMFLQYFREEGIEVKKVTIHFLRRQCYIKRSNKNVKRKRYSRWLLEFDKIFGSFIYWLGRRMLTFIRLIMLTFTRSIEDWNRKDMFSVILNK